MGANVVEGGGHNGAGVGVGWLQGLSPIESRSQASMDSANLPGRLPVALVGLPTNSYLVRRALAVIDVICIYVIERPTLVYRPAGLP